MNNQLFEVKQESTVGALRAELDQKYPNDWPLAWFLFEPADIHDMAEKIGVEVSAEEIETVLGIMNKNRKWFRQMIIKILGEEVTAGKPAKSPF